MFNPYIMGDHEIMLSNGMLDFLKLKIGNTVTFAVDVDVPDETEALFHASALLCALVDEPNFITRDLILGSRTQLSLTFIVAASYEKSSGKFPSGYGNVMLTDCNYAFSYVFDLVEQAINTLRHSDMTKYLKLKA